MVLALAGGCLFLLARLHTSLDDAYITFQYARNLANGHGFVFFRGAEPLQGTTTPLFTLLLALVHRTGIEIPVAATVVGAICHAFTVLCLVKLGRAWELPKAGWFMAGLYATTFPAIATAGMETPLYALLIVLTFLSASRGSGEVSTRTRFPLGPSSTSSSPLATAKSRTVFSTAAWGQSFLFMGGSGNVRAIPPHPRVYSD